MSILKRLIAYLFRRNTRGIPARKGKTRPAPLPPLGPAASNPAAPNVSPVEFPDLPEFFVETPQIVPEDSDVHVGDIPRSPPRPPSTAVVVGLDFGTHSTKLLLRKRNSETAQLMRIDKSHPAYPPFAAPSLVKVHEKHVYFGSRSLDIPGGTLFRSLKVRLLAAPSPNCDDEENALGLTPDLMVAWFLSWCMDRIRRTVEKYITQDVSRLFINVAAPMDHFENEQLKTRYLKIVHAAWQSVFGEARFPMRQSTHVDEATHRFASWLAADVPSRETRLFEVLPESVAPIVSLSRDPQMDPGMYMIVDMGAGTTELSVNHVGEVGADQRVLCYDDNSTQFGGDDFDSAEQYTDGAANLSRRIDKLVAQFMGTFRPTWCRAYQKDGRNPAARERWRHFRVLLTGGGARRPEIERAIRSTLPHPPWPVGEEQYDVSWHEPTGIVLDMNESAQKIHLLAVAHGLSVPRQQWPIFFLPSEIDTQQAPQVVEQPQGHWYVG